MTYDVAASGNIPGQVAGQAANSEAVPTAALRITNITSTLTDSAASELELFCLVNFDVVSGNLESS
jgi:hypothetical protein